MKLQNPIGAAFLAAALLVPAVSQAAPSEIVCCYCPPCPVPDVRPPNCWIEPWMCHPPVYPQPEPDYPDTPIVPAPPRY